MQMSLFDNCKMPTDDRALEILQRISELWEDNACTQRGAPRIYHRRVSREQKEALIEISQFSPHILEYLLNEGISLHNILRVVDGEVNFNSL